MGKHVKPNEKRSAVPGKSSAASGQPYKRTESRTARSVRFGSFGFAGELGVVAAAFALALLLRYIPVTGWARVAAFVVPLAIAGEQALKENGFSVYSVSEKSVNVSVTAKRL